MDDEKILVECYSGYKANERPVAFTYRKDFFHPVLQKDILRLLIGSLIFDTPLDINK